MNNQERAESAFAYFMECGDVTIGDVKHGADTLTRQDVIRAMDIDVVTNFAISCISDDIVFDAREIFDSEYELEAMALILDLVNKHYDE